MSVQAFTLYNKAKRNLGRAVLNLSSVSLYLHLITSAGNFATLTLSTYGSLTSEVLSANNYARTGKLFPTITWSVGASAKQYALKAGAVVQTATGGAIANVKGAVVIAMTGASAKDAANKLLCFASLSSGQFSISQNNTLTLTPNASGIFTLT